MGLTGYGLAAAIGYHIGQPHGRQQLRWLRRQIIGLSRRPAARDLRERGWDIAGECALAARNLVARKLRGKSRPAPAATRSLVDGTGPNGFGGRTVAEDSQAAITGIAPPAPGGRVQPTVLPADRPSSDASVPSSPVDDVSAPPASP